MLGSDVAAAVFLGPPDVYVPILVSVQVVRVVFNVGVRVWARGEPQPATLVHKGGHDCEGARVVRDYNENVCMSVCVSVH